MMSARAKVTAVMRRPRIVPRSPRRMASTSGNSGMDDDCTDTLAILWLLPAPSTPAQEAA